MQQPEEGAIAVDKAEEVVAAQTEKSPDRIDQTIIDGSNKSLGATGKTTLSIEEDAAFAHLPEQEKEILKRQLDAPKVKISFFGLYRYASRLDLLVIAISALSAIVAGAAMPLFTVGPMTLQKCGEPSLMLKLDPLRLLGIGISRHRTENNHL
jgi:ATP-binding cassette subfamily B (MDR/TAP) protein 1